MHVIKLALKCYAIVEWILRWVNYATNYWYKLWKVLQIFYASRFKTKKRSVG